MSIIDEGLRIDTPEKAAWAIRKYRTLAQRKARNDALAASEQRRISSWLETTNAPVEAQMEFYAAHLEGFAMSERARGRKSFDAPDGSVKTRTTAPTYEVDKSTFISWAQEAKREELLRISFAPDLAAIKAAVVVDGVDVLDPLSGEVIPGLTPVPERVSTTIVPDMDAIDLDDIEGADNDFE